MRSFDLVIVGYGPPLFFGIVVLPEDGLAVGFDFDTCAEEQLVDPKRVTRKVVVTGLDILEQNALDPFATGEIPERTFPVLVQIWGAEHILRSEDKRRA